MWVWLLLNGAWEQIFLTLIPAETVWQRWTVCRNVYFYSDKVICNWLYKYLPPEGATTNCAQQPYFRLLARGIGYSFQLAITTSRIYLIDYGTATAQSWLEKQIMLAYLLNQSYGIMGFARWILEIDFYALKPFILQWNI